MFQYEYTMTDNEYIAFNRHALRHTPEGKKSVWAFRCVLPLIAVVALLAFWLAQAAWYLILAEAIALVILSVVYAIRAEAQLLKNAEKQLRKAEKKGTSLYSKAGTIVFDGEGIQDNDGQVDMRLRYAGIHELHVTQQALYIFLRPMQAIVLPTHCVGGSAAVEELVEFLQTVIPAPKIVRVE